jgi:hypothetical protein
VNNHGTVAKLTTSDFFEGTFTAGKAQQMTNLNVASELLPKFESYRCSRNSPNFLTKVSNVYEQFQGIGRLVWLETQKPIALSRKTELTSWGTPTVLRSSGRAEA